MNEVGLKALFVIRIVRLRDSNKIESIASRTSNILYIYISIYMVYLKTVFFIINRINAFVGGHRTRIDRTRHRHGVTIHIYIVSRMRRYLRLYGPVDTKNGAPQELFLLLVFFFIHIFSILFSQLHSTDTHTHKPATLTCNDSHIIYI